MLIRKSTKEHSALFEVLKKYGNDKDRKKLILLFTIQPGEGLEEKIAVENSGAFSDFYYNLNYNSILHNFLDKDHQLHKSDEQDDLFYFESNYAPVETPFQLSTKIQDELNAILKDKKFKARAPKELEKDLLEDIPVEQRKEAKVRKLKMEPEVHVEPEIEEESEEEVVVAEETEEEIVEENEAEVEEAAEEQPDFDLSIPIIFTGLQNEVSKKPKLIKEDILEYYYHISEFILPFVKDRPLLTKGINEILEENNRENPDWLKTVSLYIGELEGDFILGQNKEHLLYLIEAGVLQIDAWTSLNKNLKNPDVLLIDLIPQEVSFEKVKEAGLEALNILEITEIGGFIKTTGEESLTLHISLDGKSDFATTKKLADFIALLISRKAADVTALEQTRKTVFLDTSANAMGKTFLMPYSINADTFLVATPVTRAELKGLNYEDFDMQTIQQRLQEETHNIFPEKINAKGTLEKLDKRYSFLL